MVKHFKPAWWCRGPHCQTLWPVVIRRRSRFTLRRKRLELPDGDFVDLDWTPNRHGPLVVLLHGLEGSSQSHYATTLLTAVQRQDWRGVLLHFRGCSGVPNRLPRSYHSGETGDLNTFITHLRREEPGTPIAVVGVSLGGNVLLKWLGEQAEAAPVSAGVAISVPFLLDVAAVKLNSGFSRIYQWRLLQSLRNSLINKSKTLPLPLDLSEMETWRTFRAFDDNVTAPLHGFRNVDHYYASSSSRQYLKSIRRPTLILHANDDPFVTPAAIPAVDELSELIEFELSAHGGHVGFVGGRWPWSAEYWLEQRVINYLQQHLGTNKNG